MAAKESGSEKMTSKSAEPVPPGSGLAEQERIVPPATPPARSSTRPTASSTRPTAAEVKKETEMPWREVFDKSFRAAALVGSLVGLAYCGPHVPELLRDPVAVACAVAIVLVLVLPFER